MSSIAKIALFKEKAEQRIIEEYESQLKLTEEGLCHSEEVLITAVDKAGFSYNALLPLPKIALEEEGGLLPDGVFVGDLCDTNRSRIVGPALLPFADAPATGFLIGDDNENEVSTAMQLLALRLKLVLPINMTEFHFVDFHSFGQSRKHLSRLSNQVLGDVVSDNSQLRDFLTMVENIIKERNVEVLSDYESIQDYNKNKESVCLNYPYHFIFISHLHHGIDKTQLDRIATLCANQNATKAGVFIFYSLDASLQSQYGVSYEDVLSQSMTLTKEGSTYKLGGSVYGKEFQDNYRFCLDCTVPDNLEDIVGEINRRVSLIKPTVVSFDSDMENRMSTGNFWKESSLKGISIPIGIKGKNEKVYFSLSERTNDFFAMVGGRPGWGKTVLLHNIICNGSILYSPEELEFYLIDCTNGTGFHSYADLPHARFVSITNQKEYTDSALEQLIIEMERRANLFKEASVSVALEKIEDYRTYTQKPLSRIVAIIDEVQVLFEKGRGSLYNGLINKLTKIIKEGRKYGIGIVFCTQSYKDFPIDMGLVTLRIAFNLESGDSRRILGDEGAENLKEKGQAILKNEKSYFTFKCAFSNKDKRKKFVDFCIEQYEKLPGPKPKRHVFDGKEISDIGKNQRLFGRKEALPADAGNRVWIGVPSFIRDEHEYFTFKEGQNSNLLITGDDMDSAYFLLALANYQFAMNNKDNGEMFVFDFIPETFPHYTYLSSVTMNFPNLLYCKKNDLKNAIERIEKELKERIEANQNGKVLQDRKKICLTLAYVQSAKELKKNSYRLSETAQKMMFILQNGSEFGIHVIVYAYSHEGYDRVFDSKEGFGNRIVLSGGKMRADYDLEEPQPGHGVLITEDRVTTYDSDPFVIYNCYTPIDQPNMMLKSIFRKIHS